MDRLVSVIVPVYNTAPYLDRCVQSVLKQTWQSFELLLIDDGSTDGSGAMCDAYALNDARIRVLHKPNGGVSSARNMGLQNMRGDWFILLDSDDSLELKTLQHCMEAAADGADVVVFGRQEIVDGICVSSESYGNEELTDMVQMVRKILTDRHSYGGGYPNKCWRTAAFSTGGIPLFQENLFYVEDMEWVIRMLLRAGCAHVSEASLYHYHLREDSISHSEVISEKRLIGYHDTMACMVADLAEYPELHHWFDGVRWTELINSIIDARMKHQTSVCKALYQKLDGRVRMLLQSDLLTAKTKLRLAGIALLLRIKLV